MKVAALLHIILALILCQFYSFGQGRHSKPGKMAIRWDSLPGIKAAWNNNSFGWETVLYADSNYLYMSGAFNGLGTEHIQGIARWNGIKWDSMGAGIDGLYYATGSDYLDNANAITTYQNKLYVGGFFTSLGEVNAYSIGTWDGSIWDSLPIQPFNSNYNPGIWALTVINNNLYVGGDFVTVAGFRCKGIAQWDGSNWSSLNFPNLENFNGVLAICAYNGSIYAAGSFCSTCSASDSTANILRYDSTGWHIMGNGIPGDSWINPGCMVVYKGELYVAGFFFQSAGNAGNCIQRWDGTKWKGVGGGIDWEVFDLLVYNDKLYAVGSFTHAGGVPASGIAEWDGAKWCSLGSTFDNTIVSVASYKDSLYIGGGFWTIDGDSIKDLAKWTGGNYVGECGSDAVGVTELKVESGKLKVEPNPNNGAFTLVIASEAKQSQTIQVYNVLGQEVYSSSFKIQNSTTPVGGQAFSINLSAEPSGVYLYRMLKEDGSLLAEGKIVVGK